MAGVAALNMAKAADDGCDGPAGSYAGVVPARRPGRATGPIVALPQTPCATLPDSTTPNLSLTIEAMPQAGADVPTEDATPSPAEPRRSGRP